LKWKWTIDKNTVSKGSNIPVVACISENGLEYSEKWFGAFTSEKCNEFICHLLGHIARTNPLENVVIAVDNAPYHTNVEDVFDETEFTEAKLLRRGPYSPIFNPIETASRHSCQQ
jgi:hypothetical protein